MAVSQRSREAVVLFGGLAEDLAVVLHLVVLGVDGRVERALVAVREPDRRQRDAPVGPDAAARAAARPPRLRALTRASTGYASGYTK